VAVDEIVVDVGEHVQNRVADSDDVQSGAPIGHRGTLPQRSDPEIAFDVTVRAVASERGGLRTEMRMTYVASRGTEIHYAVRGHGTPILLVAGTGYSGETWHPDFLDALAATNTVVTFDHRGTGRSPGTDDDYTTRLFAQDALAVVEQVGRVHVVGHSMGGRVAQELYFQQPDAVASIVLGASGAGHPEPIELRRVGIPIRAATGLLELGYRGYITDKHRRKFFTERFARDRPAEVEWLDDAYWRSRPAIADYLKHVRARQAHSTVDRLPDLAVPTLVVVGTDDTDEGGTGSHVAGAAELAKLIPGARFESVPGARHGIFWENRHVLAGLVLDFTSGVRASSP
jgi:pimeloyl-ACP methyl ester carboxylesterase